MRSITEEHHLTGVNQVNQSDLKYGPLLTVLELELLSWGSRGGLIPQDFWLTSCKSLSIPLFSSLELWLTCLYLTEVINE